MIESELTGRLHRMVGFRNAVVHHYQRMDMTIVRAIIASGLDDLVAFGDRLRAYLAG